MLPCATFIVKIFTYGEIFMSFSTHHLSWGGIAAVVCIAVGSHWDTVIHLTIGHTLLAPAHLLLLLGLALFSFCGVIALIQSRKEGGGKVRRGTKIVAWGGGVVFFSMLIFDELWHEIFGIDQTAWSPPHLAASSGMIIALFGMVLVMIRPSSPAFRFISFQDTKTTLVCAAMFLVVLFNFIEFDLPSSKWLAIRLPGFFYPVFLTVTITFFFLLIAHVSYTIGMASVAALIAWIFFTIVGIGVETITHFSYVKIPFLIFLPAFLFDLLLLRSRKTIASQLRLAVITCACSYWGIVGWAVITKLPQRLSGGLIQWVLWFAVFLIAVSFLLFFLAQKIARQNYSLLKKDS